MQLNNIFKNKKIAIFEPNSDFATNPSLICIAEEFIAQGAKVDIMMPGNGPYPQFLSDVKFYRYPQKFTLWKKGIRETLYIWKTRWRDYFWFILLNLKCTLLKYDLIIGIDSHGIITAYKYAKNCKTALVYLSFEIFFNRELIDEKEKKEKKLECIASQFADLVIIQDELRAKMLASENKIPLNRFAYLPVSPRSAKINKKSDYIRDRFSIPKNKTVVLHSGSFDYWTYATELIESAKNWPNDFVLVIHTRYKPSKTDNYLEAIRKANQDNILLSTEPLNQKDYEQFVSSADIGLVLYKPIGPSRYTQNNIKNIGLASGKFSYFMKYGLPIITVDQKFYRDLLSEYTFGMNILSFNEMSAALKLIKANYSDYSSEARRLFKEKLNFDIFWPILCKRLMEIMKH